MILSSHRNPYFLLLALICYVNPVAGQSQRYELVNDQSYLHIYTGAEGFLRSFSHEHLVSVRGFSGEIIWDGLNSTARLVLAADNFLVDQDYERSIAIDSSFHEPVSDSIQTGTRQNMRGQRVLAAESYPEILVDLSVVSFEETQVVVDMSIRFKDQWFQFQRGISLVIHGNVLHAEADFELNHSELGLRPYSVGAGLARVAESLRFHVVIHARLSDISSDPA